MYYGNGMGGWGVVLMALSNLLFWSLVIAGVVVLVRYLGHGFQRADSADVAYTPRRVLAERFARGEIDEEEVTYVGYRCWAPHRGPMAPALKGR